MKGRIFCVFSVLLLLTLCFTACDTGTPGDGNGGTISGNNGVITYYITDGETARATIGDDGNLVFKEYPKRIGYQFLGLYNAPEGGSRIVSPTGDCGGIEINGSMKLYAHWSPLSYTLQFSPEGGSLDAESMEKSVLYGETLSGFPIPKRDGYEFIGWFDEDGTQYSVKETIRESKKIFDASKYPIEDGDDAVTLYARWGEKKITVIFDYNKGTYQTEAKEFAYGSELLPSDLPEASDDETRRLEFVGWSLYRDRFVEYKGKLTEDRTLYACWREYKIVTFHYGDGSMEQLRIYRDAGEVPCPEPESKHYHTFDGWFDTKLFSGLPIKDISFNSGVKELYAKWIPKQYNLHFVTDTLDTESSFTPEKLDSMVLDYHTSLTSLPNPSCKGYEFIGWFDATGNQYSVGGTVNDNKLIFNEENYPIGEDGVTLYARWKEKPYTITFDPQNGGEAFDKTVTLGANLPPVPKPVRPGYTFLGYYDAAVGGTQYYDADMTCGTTWSKTEDITLYAHWEALTYKVSFHANQGSGVQSAVTVTYGAEMPQITVVPTRQGYVFLGYYDALTGGTKYYNADLTSAAAWDHASDKVLYARWQGAPYYVSFHANNGTGLMEVQEFESGVFECLNSNMFTRVGYTFAGWNTKADGSGTAYADQASVQNLTSTNGETVTLYAQWTVKKVTVTLEGNSSAHKVTFDLNGASGTAPAPQYVTKTSGLTYPPIPTRSGYIFAGWYTTPIPLLGTPYDFTAKVTKDITLYARWLSYSSSATPIAVGENTIDIKGGVDNYFAFVPLTTGTVTVHVGKNAWISVTTSADESGSHDYDSVTYSVTKGKLYYIHLESYKNNTSSSYVGTTYLNITGISTPSAGGLGDGEGLIKTQIAYGQKFALEVPTKNGYTFAGWYDGEGGTGTQYTDASGVGLKTWDQEEDLSLYPKWLEVAIIVEFDKQGGTGGSAGATLSYGSGLPEATAPTKPGYTFMGYYSAIAGGTKYYNADMTSAGEWTLKENMILYARWSANTYTITFDKQDGSDASSEIIAYGANLPTVPKPVRPGYTFLGYYDAAVGGTQYYDADMTCGAAWSKTEDVTLYAHWEAITYKVSFHANQGSGVQTYITVTYGAEMPKITVAPTRSGYVFLGYYDALVGGTKYYNADLTSANVWANTSDKVLYAHWQSVPYYVSFHANNGTGTMDLQEFEHGVPEYLDSNTFTRVGYTFAGWNTKADGSGTAYADQASVLDLASTSGETVTLYAQWNVKKVTVTLTGVSSAPTVTFDLNGASGTAPAPQTVTKTVGLTYPAIPTRSGYIFAGWYANSDCSGNPYDFTAKVTEDITLYARWLSYSSSAAPIAVGGNTINIKGGVDNYFAFVPLTTGTITVHVGKNAWIAVTTSASDSGSHDYDSVTYSVTKGKLYYIHLESYMNNTSSSYVGTTYLNITGIGTPSAGGLGDGGDAKETMQLTYGQEFTLEVPTKAGCIFAGWYDGEGGTGTQYTDATGAGIRAWDKEENTTLYPKWNTIEYNIDYELDGGTNGEGNPSSYNAQTETITLSAPVKEGYTFIGWTSDAVKVPTKNFVINQGSTGNITITANWIEYEISDITYDTGVKKFKLTDTLNAEYFGAACTDTDGNAVTVTASFVKAPVAGETASVLLVATSGGKTKQIVIEGVKIYGTPTINIGKTAVQSTVTISASAFEATAKDSFGETLSVSVSLVEGESYGGGYRTYEFKAVDCVGNEVSLCSAILVYCADDIKITVNEITGIKVGSTCEEFGAAAKDSFGNACLIQTEIISGDVEKAGSKINIRFTATDIVGNTKTMTVSDVKVYGTPVASMNVAEVTDQTSANDIYVVRDSFGNVLDATITFVNTPIAGSLVTVRVIATDAVGNQLNAEYELPVICSMHSIGANCTCEVCGSIVHTEGAGGVCRICGESLSDAQVWDGTVASSYASGSGTASDPYIIETGAQLAYLASRVNAGTSYSGYYFRLDSDIDLNNIEWTPIGTGSISSGNDYTATAFSGSFDGNGHDIINLKIVNTSAKRAGLFGALNGAKITKLSITGADVYIKQSHVVSGGILAGTMKDTTVVQCMVAGKVVVIEEAPGDTLAASAGAICGVASGASVIENCLAQADISGKTTRSWNAYIGGIVGRVASSETLNISKCGFVGTVNADAYETGYSAGILGLSAATVKIKDCFAVADIDSSDNKNAIVLGWDGNKPTVSNTYYSSNATSSYGTPKSPSDFQSESWLKSTLGWDFDDVWTFADGEEYPVLKAFQ